MSIDRNNVKAQRVFVCQLVGRRARPTLFLFKNNKNKNKNTRGLAGDGWMEADMFSGGINGSGDDCSGREYGRELVVNMVVEGVESADDMMSDENSGKW
jgi:hypothetical protein